MEMGLLALGAGCFLAGGVLGWIFQHYRYAAWEGASPEEFEELQEELRQKDLELARREQTLTFLEGELGDSQREREKQGQQLLELRESLVREQTERTSSENRVREQRREFDEIRERLQKDFAALANAIFEEKTTSFNRMSRESLENLLIPLGERIADFRSRVETVYTSDTRDRSELREQVRQLGELNQHMAREAQNLTEALKGQVKVMGNWGEMVLERVLDLAGLGKDREYRLQPSFTTPEGKRLQPDAVIYLPGGRHLVVDSKVSLVAYEGYCREDSPEVRERYLKEHLASLNRHMVSLKSKGYEALEDLGTPDFVFMFVPLDPALLLAQEKEENFMQRAFEQGVFPVSPGTLLFALRTVANLWQREKQNRHALEIARQSGELYDKFVLFVEDLENLGEHLQRARGCYEECRNRLIQGRGNLVRRTEMLRELGARARKELPRDLVDQALEEDLRG